MLAQEARRHSPHTINHYRISLKHLTTFMADRGIDRVETIEARSLREFMVDLQRRFKPKTANGVASDARAFFRFLVAEEVLTKNPMANVELPKLDLEILPAFSSHEVTALLKQAAGRSSLDLRNRAMMLVLLDSGVRLFELVAMSVGDVDLQTGWFKVLGKGRKERICPVSPVTVKSLKAYMRVREGAPGEPLWLGTQGPLSRSGVGQVLDRIGERAGVHAHPHKFRRTCALTMLRNGADIFSVQHLLGHTDLTVLKRYLALTQSDYLEAHRKHSPVMKLT